MGPDPEELPEEVPDLEEIDPFEAEPSEYEDLDEFVRADWSEGTTARHRVREVIVRATSPQSAADVAELADVSEPTSRKKLNELAEEGTVFAEATDNGRVYQRDPDWYRIKRIRELAQQPQATLEPTLRRLEQEIEGYKDKYDANSPEELLLSDDPLDEETWEDISHWRTASVDRKYLRSALLYADLQRSEEQLFGDIGGNGNDDRNDNELYPA
jgi:hypothetical protein